MADSLLKKMNLFRGKRPFAKSLKFALLKEESQKYLIQWKRRDVALL